MTTPESVTIQVGAWRHTTSIVIPLDAPDDHTPITLSVNGRDIVALDIDENGIARLGHWPDGEEWVVIQDFGHISTIGKRT